MVMDPHLEKELQKLLDKQAITELIHRYAHAVDRGDAEMLRSILHPDAVCDLGAVKFTAQEYYEAVKKILVEPQRYWAVQHRVSNILIDLRGDMALSECVAASWHGREENGQRYHDFNSLRYLDRFERRSGEWRFVHRKAIYEWNLEIPSTTDSYFWFLPDELVSKCEFSKRGEEDYYYRRLKDI